MHTSHSIFLSCVLCLSVLAGAGCDDSDSGSSGIAPVSPVGPNLSGTWSGRYGVIRTSDSQEQAVKATIRHSGSAVMIQTSLTGVGASLSGTIEPNGEMNLVDAFDGEVWTTYFTPATSDRVQIADFLYDSELGAASPLQIIDLTPSR